MTAVVMNKHVCAKLTALQTSLNFISGIFGCILVNDLVIIAGLEQKQSSLRQELDGDKLNYVASINNCRNKCRPFKIR